MPGIETQVDSLILDIQVKDNTSGESSAKKISTLNRVLNNFEKTVKALDVKVFKNKFSSMATAIKPFVKELNSAKSTLLALDRILKKTSVGKSVEAATSQIGTTTVETPSGGEGKMPSAQSGTPQELKEDASNGNAEKELAAAYGDLTKRVDEANGSQTRYYTQMENGEKTVSRVSVRVDEQGKAIANSAKLVGKTTTEATSAADSFFASVKRIALYRLIRTALKAIVSSMKEGLDNITAFDAKSRKTMSDLSSSVTIMKNSVGLAIMPLLEAITPIVQGIARGIGTLANAISYLTAKIKGENSYLKVNLDYWEEINKQSHLLEFDEFSSLSNMDNSSNMFTRESMDGASLGGILGDLNDISAVLAGISATLIVIGAAKLIGWLMDGSLAKGIKGLSTNTLSFLGSVNGLAVGIGVLVGGLVSFITNFDKMGTTAKVLIPILAVLAAVLVGLAVAHAAAKAGLAAPVMAGITAAALAAGIVLAAGTAIAVAQHANGGMFEGTGTIYHQAGEAGAEIVATGSRGTGVTNIAQFKQAMVEALSDYNAARQTDEVAEIVINLDGKQIADLQTTNNANALMRKYNIVLKPR